MTAAEVNAELIERIIALRLPHVAAWQRQDLAREIVRLIPALRPAQQEFLADGNTRTIPTPLPWRQPWTAPRKPAPHSWANGWSG